MTDIFSLAPEGQAWTDDAAKGNAARPEDYNPTFFAGSVTALPRGVAEGAIGLAQTGVAASKKIISDPEYLQQFAPTYAVLRGLLPQADQQLNETYDATSKALAAGREYVKPDANSQGVAAQVLEGLGQFAPAIGATVVGGPVAGAAVAAGSTFEPARQEFIAKGVNPDTAAGLAAEQSVANAAGMALPAGVGGRLLTRLTSGVAINTGFGAANRFAVGETLDENGYSDLAKQYRVWDKQAIVIDSVLGAAFGGVHHLASAKNAGPEVGSVQVDESASTGLPNSGDLSTSSAVLSPETPASVPESGPVVPESADSVPPTSAVDSAPAPTYESRVAELQGLADNLIPVGDRKVLASDIHGLQYWYDQAASELQQVKDAPLSGSGKALATARAQRTARVNELDLQMGMLKEQIDTQNATLADNSRGGRFFEAKADLSRLQQGVIPESLRGLVPEAEIKPSDIDAAHALNEGLHYDIESAPVVHGSMDSVNSHVAAMDQATSQLMRGEPVNVDQQIRGLDGIMKPDAMEQGEQQRAAMESAFKENGISFEPIREEPAKAPQLREGSAFAGAGDEATGGAGQVSTDPDTGTVISSNNFDLLSARDMSQANPELTVTHPDTGEQVTLAQALADLDKQIATTQKESRVYSVAAACFLRNS